MKYFKDPNNQQVFGYDETDGNQGYLIQKAIDSGWEDVTSSWPPPPTLDQTTATITASIQMALDGVAQSWGYDNLAIAATYATSTNVQYAADASSLIEWRDKVWMWAIPLFPSITAGESPKTFMVGMPEKPSQPKI